MSALLKINTMDFSMSGNLLFSAQNLQMDVGDRIHLVGDSGSGKTLFGLGLIGIYPDEAQVHYDVEYPQFAKPAFEALRRQHVGFIFQQPKAYFNPVKTCGQQLVELRPPKLSREEFIQRIHSYVSTFELETKDSILKKYPHELSIGQLQRVYAISALIRKPKVIIADEPFAHLDESTARILAGVMEDYLDSEDAGLLLISHEPPGYFIDTNRHWKLQDRQISECDQVEGGQDDGARGQSNHLKTKLISDEAIVDIRHASLTYRRKMQIGKSKTYFKALDDVSIKIFGGDRLGLMGGSGSGKTSLALLVCGILKPTDGSVFTEGKVDYSLRSLIKREASTVQLVFQDPYASFNSAETLGSQILTKHNRERIIHLLDRLDLPAGILDRYSKTVSGGELQRLALIRALSGDPQPQVLILDEALSAVDQDRRSRILDLLHTDYADLAVLFISHRYYRLKPLCNAIYFLDSGRLIYNLHVQQSQHQEIPSSVKGLMGIL